MSSGAAATGVVLGILMALAIGGVAGSTADLDPTATDIPSDLPTAVDGGIGSTELASWARESWSTAARIAPSGHTAGAVPPFLRCWSWTCAR